MTSDDVVTFALEGLPARYENISTIIAHRDSFPDLKTIRSMLTTEEMRKKSRAKHTLVDDTSSLLMVLLENSGPNTCRSAFSREKFLHNEVHGRVTSTTSTKAIQPSQLTHTDIQSLQNLLVKLGLNGTSVNMANTLPASTNPSPNTTPVALYTHTGPPPCFANTLAQQQVQPNQTLAFSNNIYPGQTSTGHLGLGGQVHLVGLQAGSQGLGGQVGQQQSASGFSVGSGQLAGQETTLPHAFTNRTLQDHAPGRTWIQVLLRYDSTGPLYPVTNPSQYLRSISPVSTRGINVLDIQEVSATQCHFQ
ncbi:hypothetical protein Tco_0545025 [Tanacetum coccineum]